MLVFLVVGVADSPDWDSRDVFFRRPVVCGEPLTEVVLGLARGAGIPPSPLFCRDLESLVVLVLFLLRGKVPYGDCIFFDVDPDRPSVEVGLLFGSPDTLSLDLDVAPFFKVPLPLADLGEASLLGAARPDGRASLLTGAAGLGLGAGCWLSDG